MHVLRVLMVFLAGLALSALDGPRLEIQPAGLQHLGSLGPREKRTLVYTLRNASDRPLALKVANQPAGLRVEGLALQRVLQPGEALPLSLEVDATGQGAWLKRKVELVTDDPRQGHYVLPVEAAVRPDLTVDRLRAVLSPARHHESPEAVFQMVRETGDPLVVRLTEALPPYLEFSVDSQNGKALLRLVFRPAQVTPGALQGLETIRLETNVPGQSELTLYLTWSIQTPLLAKPARLVFDSMSVQDVELVHPKGLPFRLGSVRVEGEGFECEPLPLNQAPAQHLRVHRSQATSCRAMLWVTIEGDSEAMPLPLVGLPTGTQR